jgi:hypothetical protein
MSLRLLSFLGVLALLLTAAAPVGAHEVRPGLLHLNEVAPDRFETLWRVPARGQLVLSINPRYPETCARIGLETVKEDGVRSEKQGEILCDGGLAGAAIEFEGLSRLRTDVLLRADYIGGGSETHRATPADPSVTLLGKKSLLQVAASYTVLGMEHILLGLDHLLFVAALLLLVRGWRALIGTITAFTLAHSLTLAAASLKILSVPSGLIEAFIALSIVFVAAEALHKMRGRESITTKRPWLIAFAFGLLHGFGFAGALAEVGLPSEAIPTALLFFNIGVELGQLIFVAALVLLAKALRAFTSASLAPLRVASSYAIGTAAGYWTVERVLILWL